MNDYKHWQLETDSDNILWLTLERADSRVNSLNAEVLHEFNTILDHIEQSHPRGVIIRSGKHSGFIAGADIQQFGELKDVGQARELIRDGQKIFDKLATLKIPTVAMIQGFCMGGGTELSLACDYRVAEDGDKTRIGLPEVKLGIHPGWGGTVRLPRLIGVPKAMDLILTGRALRAKAAQRLGVIDVAVPMRHLIRAARQMIIKQPSKQQPGTLLKLINHSLARSLLAKMLYKQVSKKARRDHYPAPFAVIDNWLKYGIDGEKPMLQEADSISELLLGSTSRNLVRVFMLQERMKALAKGVEFNRKHVHVIGAGTMGGDIAAWCAFKGFTVTLQDRAPEYIAPAIGRAYKLCKKKLKKPRPIQQVMDRLIPDQHGLGIQQADMIIEAIYENLEAKQDLFKSLEAQAKPEAILASNTSSIPLDEISTVMEKPERLVGIHFFNPVAMMPLVEVVKSDKTDVAVLAQATKFVTTISKFPVIVKSSPGFLVNRALVPYMMEAMTLYEEGIPIGKIDQAAKDFGMPMGPIELADTVGLDVCLSVAQNLSQHFGGTVPDKLVKMVEAKKLGKKTGQGFHEYKKGKPVKDKNVGSADKTLATRMINRMLNETMACLREGVIEDADFLDAGMIFGTGFAPFRGGPMQYARDHGIAEIMQELTDLSSQYGERFKADEGWSSLVKLAA